jgi:hypothetical protein
VAQVNVNTSLIARKQQEVEKYVDRLRKQAVERESALASYQPRDTAHRDSPQRGRSA